MNNASNCYVIAGDLNARNKDWEDKVNNKRGEYIKSWLAEKSARYRMRFFPPSEAMYTRNGSYLDVCLAESRLDITDTIGDKLRTLDYDSDHRAIAFRLDLVESGLCANSDRNNKARKNFKLTN